MSIHDFTHTDASPLDDKRIILAHDYLIQMGGAERVMASLHQAFPQAPIYVSATDYARLLSEFHGAEILNTWMQHIPGINTHFKKFFPVYPFAFKSLGCIDADLAIVSSSGFAKWLQFTERTKVFCYCHTPPRFFWQTDHYLANEVQSAALRGVAKLFIPWLRASDYRAAQKIDFFIANSKCVQERIRTCYGRTSVVIYPPVEVDRFEVCKRSEGYYLIVSRLVSYKGIDRAVRAFSECRKRLIVVGDGPDRARLQALAGSTVQFKGHVSDAEVKRYLENCYAFVFPGLEDFGITAVEAQAAGKPVLAFGAGGALETIVDGATGLFFYGAEILAIKQAIERFEQIHWDRHAIRANAEQFASGRFIAAMRELIESTLAD